MTHGTTTAPLAHDELDLRHADPERSVLAAALRHDWVPASPMSITEYLAQGRQARLVGVFPGLGSRAAYRDLGRFLLDTGIDEVTSVYRQAAHALSPGKPPESVLEMPAGSGRLERQARIGAQVLTHSLAFEAHLRATAERSGTALTFRAYTGESFGILASAVASGSISVAAGVRIARAFTPLSLVAAEGLRDGEPIARELSAYLPRRAAGRPLVPEPFHVIGVSGTPESLAGALEEIGRHFAVDDVEIHKRYSATRTNVYVRGAVMPAFGRLAARLDGIQVAELKEPTTFLAHSRRLRAVRTGLEQFMDRQGIEVGVPRVPLIANHRPAVLTTAAEVREAILAMTDQVMDSRATSEILDTLHADLAVELGPGGRSVELLQDNNLQTPVTAYTGAGAETARIFRTINGVSGLRRELERTRPAGEHLEPRHHDMLRAIFRSCAESSFTEDYTVRALGRIIVREMLRPEQDGSPAYYRLLEAFQHTWAYRNRVDVGSGELVLRARLRKRRPGEPGGPKGTYAELRTLDARGVPSSRHVEGVLSAETTVIRFDGLSHVDDGTMQRQLGHMVARQPLARMVHDQLAELIAATPSGPGASRTGSADRIAYQYTLYHLLRLRRPSVVAQRDRYLRGDDALGWLTALAVSGAAGPADVVVVHDLVLRGSTDRAALRAAVDRLTATMRDAVTPVISPDGVPLYSRRDLGFAVRAIVLGGAFEGHRDRSHLAGDTWTVRFDPAATGLGRVPRDGEGGFSVTLRSDLDVSARGVNPALDHLDDLSALGLTTEKKMILRHAQGRRILSTTISGYIKADERVVGFGAGGSESMTMFLVRDGSTRVVVRKILSEALVTAAWRPDGTGVMLPPFAKARQQAEYLRHLPEPVKPYFPEVFDVLEHELPAPPGDETGRPRQEVIYEMSFVEGAEVSRYVERWSPPPAVVARIYGAIYDVLDHHVHTVNRVPVPAGTLEESYFRKIEDRLELCRRTAPHTFGPALLDPETITINGNTFRNALALVRWFRDHPAHHQVLEPRFHSLVMGDTNTENVKISRTRPLVVAQKLIEQGAPRREIDAALAAITARTLGIKFLDPRAIGFRSTGRDTVDDPMYDNKPWHNSIGHYDEIHFEHFQLDVRTGAGRAPEVRIAFDEGNPFQRAYRVRDVVEHGEEVDPEHPRGMEDHFARVMRGAAGTPDGTSPVPAEDPYWLVRFVFMMGTHFTAMPPFHFQAELDGTMVDTYDVQRRPVAIYCEGVKWLNWAADLLEGRRTSFLGVPAPRLS
ncbi:hypothetical protein [Myceligenerans crystallogenes]|uniref:ACP S-malonyltransferase n=1 Tax=Myceligenerans crystallogenes TaxID=316335 RepID=A0ABP4ZF22_9MICO